MPHAVQRSAHAEAAGCILPTIGNLAVCMTNKSNKEVSMSIRVAEGGLKRREFMSSALALSGMTANARAEDINSRLLSPPSATLIDMDTSLFELFVMHTE